MFSRHRKKTFRVLLKVYLGSTELSLIPIKIIR